MPIAPSIDNFLDVHQANPCVVLMGKLAIAYSILHAEKSSSIFFDSSNVYQTMKLSAIRGTWLETLWHALTTGVSRSNVSKMFSNVTFIVFNYDRCLELFLQQALKTYFDLDADVTRTIADSVRIFHPYGSLGPLTVAGNNGIPFGAKPGGDVLRAATSRIRTFTEANSFEETIKQDLHASLIEAEKLIFLGFSYNSMNLSILNPSKDTRITRVYGTSLGISNSDTSIIQSRVIDMTRPRYEHQTYCGVECNFSHATCANLMKEFSLSIGE